jgi:hypothetical protein
MPCPDLRHVIPLTLLTALMTGCEDDEMDGGAQSLWVALSKAPRFRRRDSFLTKKTDFP